MSIETIIKERAPQLNIGESSLDPVVLLHAIAEVETNHGERSRATFHEPAYCYGGFYFKSPTNQTLKDLSKKHGCLAHCSYSSWQILFITASELGFNGDPTDLRDDEIAIPFVISLINRRIFARYPRITIGGFADAWNSGRPDDANVPQSYIDKFEAAYKKWDSKTL